MAFPFRFRQQLSLQSSPSDNYWGDEWWSSTASLFAKTVHLREISGRTFESLLHWALGFSVVLRIWLLFRNDCDQNCRILSCYTRARYAIINIHCAQLTFIAFSLRASFQSEVGQCCVHSRKCEFIACSTFGRHCWRARQGSDPSHLCRLSLRRPWLAAHIFYSCGLLRSSSLACTHTPYQRAMWVLLGAFAYLKRVL